MKEHLYPLAWYPPTTRAISQGKFGPTVSKYQKGVFDAASLTICMQVIVKRSGAGPKREGEELWELVPEMDSEERERLSFTGVEGRAPRC